MHKGARWWADMIDTLITDAWALWLLKLWILSGIFSAAVIVMALAAFLFISAWRASMNGEKESARDWLMAALSVLAFVLVLMATQFGGWR